MVGCKADFVNGLICVLVTAPEARESRKGSGAKGSPRDLLTGHPWPMMNFHGEAVQMCILAQEDIVVKW